MQRKDKHSRYLAQAQVIAAENSTCLRANYAAIIVDPVTNVVLSTGYVGAPRDTMDCLERGTCFRIEHDIPRGTQYEICASVHAEMNAIIHCGHRDAWGAIMYLSGIHYKTGQLVSCAPCFWCLKFIINAGIGLLVMQNADGSYDIWERPEMIRVFNEAFEGEEFSYDAYARRFKESEESQGKLFEDKDTNGPGGVWPNYSMPGPKEAIERLSKGFKDSGISIKNITEDGKES